MEGLDLSAILDPQQFEELLGDDNEEKETQEPEKEPEKEKDNNEQTTEVEEQELFPDKEPESVGSEKKSEEVKEEPESINTGTPTNKNFYSSIAKALRDEGIFPDLSDENINQIKEAGDFRKLFNDQVAASLTERQKRIEEALNAGAQPSEVDQYEKTISYLDSLTDDQLSEESDQAENLRKQLIYQDFINRGYSDERAKKEVKKSLDAGTDIEDAKDALDGNKEFYSGRYNQYVEQLKNNQKAQQEAQSKQAEELRKQIMDSEEFFNGIKVDKNTRQKAYDNLTKAVYKDPESGQFYTSLQKYQRENSSDFLKNVSLLYTLTDGFKNVDKLVGQKVKREMKKGFSELEHTLNNTTRNSDGTLKFISGESADDDSGYIGKGLKLDL